MSDNDTVTTHAHTVVGPSVWNSLPDYLRDSSIGRDKFRQHLETFMFASYHCIPRIGGFTFMRYVNLGFLTLSLTLTHRLF